MPTTAALRGEEENLANDLSSKLKELGLSTLGSRALVSLLGNSPQSAGSICRSTGIPDSKIYYALEELDRAKLVESQRGVPTLYKPVEFEQMISNLSRAVNEEHQRRLRSVEVFRRQAEPLVKARSEPAEIELAYIVKGRRNIVERMLTVIGQSRKEAVLLVSNEQLWNGIASGLAQARKRRVKVGLAVTPNLREAPTVETFGDVRASSCDCNILIVDSEKLVTASHVDSDGAYAIVTSDKNMIHMSREYYDNPKCCETTVSGTTTSYPTPAHRPEH